MNEKIFNVTENHIKLLKRMYVDWEDCEFGAPVIDCKRPYGNSDVIEDIKKICAKEETICPHCEEKIFNFSDDKAREIHREMEIVLQILVSNLSISVNKYIKQDEYDSTSWVKQDE